MRYLMLMGLVCLGGCASRDDKTAWSTAWHMGKALEMGCKRPDLIGKQLRTMAERHAEQHDYEIDQEGKRHVRTD